MSALTHLIIEDAGMFPRHVVTVTIVCKAHVHVGSCRQEEMGHKLRDIVLELITNIDLGEGSEGWRRQPRSRLCPYEGPRLGIVYSCLSAGQRSCNFALGQRVHRK